MTKPTPETLAHSVRRARPAAEPADAAGHASDPRNGAAPAVGGRAVPAGADGTTATERGRAVPAGADGTHRTERSACAGVRRRSLVRSLEEVGVDVVFGIPGGAILPAYDPLFDSTKVRHILVRHEQGAGHAAEGYAQATGKVGVCMATSGPGATNLVTPIADAYMDSVPIVAITGQVGRPVDRHRRLPGGRHLRHHAADHQAQLPGHQRPRTSRGRIAEAFHLAATGRPGPVLVDIAQGRAAGADRRSSGRPSSTCPATGR